MTTAQTLFGIQLPIIQAPMAGVQGSALAAAVSSAGGLGSLPCAMLSLDALRQELSAFRALTDKPLNVNFFCHSVPPADAQRDADWRTHLAPYYAELNVDADNIPAAPERRPFNQDAAKVLVEFAPEVVSFHFGLPEKALLEQVRAWGGKIIATATTVAEAQWLDARGVDAIIAQGTEAGGHRGNFLSADLHAQMGTFALLPQIVAAVKVPVIAAGGIADSKGVAAALALGASAVQVGTAYLLCSETNTSPLHRAALQSDAARVTAITNLFTGRPARSIVNRFIREMGPIHSAVPAFPRAATAAAPLRAQAEENGSSDFSPLWAGQNTRGCKAIAAAALTHELAREWSAREYSISAPQ